MANFAGVPDTRPAETRPRGYNGGYMAAGQRAEEEVIAWLNKNPSVIGVEDLRQLRVMRDADVDLAIKIIDGRVPLAEIKSDRHLGRSGNFVFEVLRINHTCVTDHAVTLGWSARSPAGLLLLYAPGPRQIHKVSFSDYRHAAQEYTDTARKQTNISFVPTDRIKSTINILVPEKYVVSKPSYRKFDLKHDADG